MFANLVTAQPVTYDAPNGATLMILLGLALLVWWAA